MRVLIIGGTRFVGRSLAQMLLARGDQVTVANRGRTPDDLPESVERLRVDLGNTGELGQAVAGRTFDAAVDMIAYGKERVRESLLPLRDKVGQYLQCGSTGVYAPLKYAPADEDHPTDPPANLGGFNKKIEADREAAQLCEEVGLPLTIVRPTNITGEGDVPIDIWGARNPKFFQRILDGKVVSIPNDGQALLQPVHKDDVAQGLFKGMDNPCGTRIYNCSSDCAVTLDYYVEALGAILGRTPVVEHVPMEELLRRDAGKVNEAGIRFLCLHMCFRLDKARAEIGYEPKWTAEEATEQAIEWMFAKQLISK
ncbi:MAG: NAD-dependent epimerase/dehydratase family protein [Armatimonadia bacterium]